MRGTFQRVDGSLIKVWLAKKRAGFLFFFFFLFSFKEWIRGGRLLFDRWIQSARYRISFVFFFQGVAQTNEHLTEEFHRAQFKEPSLPSSSWRIFQSEGKTRRLLNCSPPASATKLLSLQVTTDTSNRFETRFDI